MSAINTFFELHNLVPIAKDSLHLPSARRGLMLRQRRLDAAPLRVPLPADVAYRFVTKAELIVSGPYPEYHLDFRALLASVVNFMFFARGLTGVSCRVASAVWVAVPAGAVVVVGARRCDGAGAVFDARRGFGWPFRCCDGGCGRTYQRPDPMCTHVNHEMESDVPAVAAMHPAYIATFDPSVYVRWVRMRGRPWALCNAAFSRELATGFLSRVMPQSEPDPFLEAVDAANISAAFSLLDLDACDQSTPRMEAAIV
eukprot:jgi/Tetstr1/457940/TSEL_044458.t1